MPRKFIIHQTPLRRLNVWMFDFASDAETAWIFVEVLGEDGEWHAHAPAILDHQQWAALWGWFMPKAG